MENILSHIYFFHRQASWKISSSELNILKYIYTVMLDHHMTNICWVLGFELNSFLLDCVVFWIVWLARDVERFCGVCFSWIHCVPCLLNLTRLWSLKPIVAPLLRKAMTHHEICYSLDRVRIAIHKRCNIMHKCQIITTWHEWSRIKIIHYIFA